MFYNLVLYKDLDVAPRWFGKNLRQHVDEKLIQEASGLEREVHQLGVTTARTTCLLSRALFATQVEGTCNGRFGYVVAVSQIISVSPVSCAHPVSRKKVHCASALSPECVCVCVCARACMRVFVYVCECARACICVFACVHVCICMHMIVCACVRAFAWVSMEHCTCTSIQGYIN